MNGNTLDQDGRSDTGNNPVFSDKMVQYHRDALTLPHELIAQGDAVKNHMQVEGAVVHSAWNTTGNMGGS